MRHLPIVCLGGSTFRYIPFYSLFMKPTSLDPYNIMMEGVNYYFSRSV